MELGRFFDNFIKLSLAFGCLFVSALVLADQYKNQDDHYNYDYRHHENKCSVIPSKSLFLDHFCITPCNPPPVCDWAYNPPAYVRCGCNDEFNQFDYLDSFYYRSDFLCWKACEEGLELGTEEFVRTIQTAPNRETVINRSRSKNPDFKYYPGFRKGIGNHCACGCWDLALNWTHYYTKAKARGASKPNVQNNQQTFFIPAWERIVGLFPLKAEGRYSLHLDFVDVEFGRKFYLSKCFVLRPQFGLRSARINQTYREESEFKANQLTFYFSDVKARTNFLAAGPRVGIDVEFDIGCGLLLFGQGMGSILFGRFANHSREHLKNFTPSTEMAIGEFDYEAKSSAYRCSRANTDLAFGMKWNGCLEWCNRSHPISLALAWEHHAFFDMNHFNFVERGFNLEGSVEPTGQNLKKHGNLFTQGLTTSLIFGF